MDPENFPARLHVLVARDARTGLVIRRGPSKKVGVFGWDRRTDEISLGQWLKGRIYERRCDLSPKGKYWIYFAMNGHWESESRGSWTAIARAPYLKALAMLPKGDCWYGGGLFVSDRNYWLNEGFTPHSVLRDSSEVVEDTNAGPPLYFGGECPHVYYNRLLRDGWEMLDIEADHGRATTIFEKRISPSAVMRKLCHAGPPVKGKGCYWDEHEIEFRDGEKLTYPDWGWAELVDRNIVYAEHGKLFRMYVRTIRKGADPILIHDFNKESFQRVSAPY